MFNKYLHSLFPPSFDWIQVEVTSSCNASCIYCPRTVFRDRWRNRHMTPETFSRLVPAFGKTKLVYLQGWGEPFLNPHFFTMAEQAKQAGCLVGTTTNGTLLDQDKIDRIIKSRLDILSFSLAHTDSRNDFIRQGAPLEMVLEKIDRVTAAKKKAGADTPAVHVAYLLLKSNKDDVQKLPALLKERGVSEVVVSTLDFPLSAELEQEVLLPRTDVEYESLRSSLEQVRLDGGRMGVPIHYQIGHAGRRQLLCTENIEKAVVISASGDVHPCVFTNLSLVQEQEDQLNFGNVNEQPLAVIWNSARYKNFRKSFSRKNLAAACRKCLKLSIS